MSRLVKVEAVRAALAAVKKDAEWLAGLLGRPTEEIVDLLGKDSRDWLNLETIALDDAVIREFAILGLTIDLCGITHNGPRPKEKLIEHVVTHMERRFESDIDKVLFSEEERGGLRALSSAAAGLFGAAALDLIRRSGSEATPDLGESLKIKRRVEALDSLITAMKKLKPAETVAEATRIKAFTGDDLDRIKVIPRLDFISKTMGCKATIGIDRVAYHEPCVIVLCVEKDDEIYLMHERFDEIFAVENVVSALCQFYDVQAVACDPYQAHNTASKLNYDNLPVTIFPNSRKTMIQPSNKLIGLVKSDMVYITGDLGIIADFDAVWLKDRMPAKADPQAHGIEGYVAACFALATLDASES